MIRRKPLIQLFAVPLVLTLATTGCATRRYVTKKVDALAAQIDQKFGATNEKIAAVASTEQRDISQVNERISTNEMKLGLASTAAQQALADALNYKLIAKADVTFSFNKFSLTPEAKASLDQIATKVQSLPRVVVEVVGFTDLIGTKNYNLDLSRKRADAVERYLVMQKVPLHVIHTVGLGEEAPPSGLEADISSNLGKRRVLIRIFGAADSVQYKASAAGGGQK